MSNNTNITGFCYEIEDDVFDGSVDSITFISNVTIGLIHLMFTVFFIVAQILIFISFYRISKRKNHNMVFDIMRHHGVVSFFQQLCHFVTSITIIFYISWQPIVLAIIGGILEAAYLCSVAFMLVLSLNRCDLMYDFKLFPSIPRKKFYLIASVLCYVYFCLMIIFFLIPNNRMTLNISSYEWDFVQDECLKSFGFIVDKWIVYGPLIVSFILYVLTFSRIVYLRSLRQKATYFYPEDFKLILNLVICYVSIIFMELCWNGSFFNIYKTEFGALVPHFVFILVSGANTTFTLFTVRDIRISVFGTCCSKSIIPASRINNTQIKIIKVNLY
uniref:7TM_GPCR_Srx domain-containing protein n=1 Tax=Strongyloides venezuelensis TaxID=75913 RepID=A0A0K0FC56_STRVS